MLTRKQHELLTYIDGQLDNTGVAPSYDEMKDAVGLKSKSGIHRLITALEERGFIRRLPHRARAVEVLKLPRQASSSKGEFSAKVVRGYFPGTTAGPEADAGDRGAVLPLYGRIAAGTPIEALREMQREVDLPASMIGSGEHYALEVEGDSMVDAGILDGDIAIVARAETAENGQIVVAFIDEHEATLKRLRRKNESVALEAANPNYETQIYGPDRVKVQGRLVGLLRRY